MMKWLLLSALLAAPSIAYAQTPGETGAICPAGTHNAMIRHSSILPGKWTTFEKAVADHQAWYAQHNSGTATVIVRMLTLRAGTPVLSDSDAVTITQYDAKAQPPHDAGWDSFISEYKASSTIKEEMRVCMPAMAH